MAILFALLTSLTNALAVTLQHIASTSDVEKSKGWQFVKYLPSSSTLAARVAGAVWITRLPSIGTSLRPTLVSAANTRDGTDHCVGTPRVQLWLHQSIRGVTWSAAIVTATGLATFLVVTSPDGRSFLPTSRAWTVPSIVCVAGGALLVALAQRGSPARRAALFASATAVMWALEATFIKATTDTISALGFGGAFTRWPVYALIVGGIVGLLCEQAALHVGPLSVSQTFIVIVDPIVSVALGIWLYRERLHHDALHLTIGVAAFYVVMCAGIVALTKTLRR